MSKEIDELKIEVAGLHAVVAELQANVVELRAEVAELKAGLQDRITAGALRVQADAPKTLPPSNQDA